jgi:hypothetical protein
VIATVSQTLVSAPSALDLVGEVAHRPQVGHNANANPALDVARVNWAGGSLQLHRATPSGTEDVVSARGSPSGLRRIQLTRQTVVVCRQVATQLARRAEPAAIG